MVSTGLTPTQFSMLRYLEREGPSPLREMAADLVMERTTVYRSIRPLEENHLVAITSHPGDARARMATLTPAGRKRIRATLPTWTRVQKSFEESVGRTQWEAISISLEMISNLAVDLLKKSDS